MPIPVQSSPSTPTLTAYPVQNSPSTPLLTAWRYKALPARAARPHFRYKTLPARAARPHFRYKTLRAHPKWLNMALFLHAGRVLYRSHHQEAKQGELCTVLTSKRPSRANCVPNARQRSSEHNNTPGPTGVKRAEGAGAPRRGAGGRQQDHSQTNFAHNFPRSLFETTRKRCNPNEAISRFEQVARELRAKLLNIPGTTAMKSAAGAGGSGCGARGRRRGLVRHIPARQMPPVWRVPASPEGQAAVPVGGGGAWPDNESTRRAKLAARTASGRAATHGCIKQPGPAGQARGADGERAGRRPRRSQAPWPGPRAPGSGCAPASAPLGHCPHHLGPRHAGRTRAHLGLSGAVEP